MKRRLGVSALLFLIALAAAPAMAQQPDILVWPQGAPGAVRDGGEEVVRVTPQGDHVYSNIHAPTLRPYLPAAGTGNGAAVIVMPGGGHRELWADHEGYAVAQWLSEHGVAAFVLKYRLSRSDGSPYTLEGHSLADAQRAIRIVRSRAAEWDIAPDAIGVMGFSAGAGLSLLTGTRSWVGDPNARDALERVSARPDFMGLIYGGRMEGITFSAETPPAFLLAGAEDRPDIAEGLPQTYLEIHRAGAPAELHILSGVGHGFGIRPTNAAQVSTWPMTFRNWLDANGFLAKAH